MCCVHSIVVGQTPSLRGAPSPASGGLGETAEKEGPTEPTAFNQTDTDAKKGVSLVSPRFSAASGRPPQAEGLPHVTPLIAIAGPTGSGKSALAVRIAEEFPGEIVNCDSLQLYRGFDVGTAKTPGPPRRKIPHHLFDVLEPSERFSAGEYASAARSAIEEISARGRLPVIAGGTGFYLRALLEGLPALPERNQDLRDRLVERERRKPGVLARLLRRLDPASRARVHARDTQKLIRALEVRILTQRVRPQLAQAAQLQGYRVLKIGLNPDRQELYKTLDARTRRMFDAGLLDEVRALMARGLSGLEKPFESLGYKQALHYLRGEATLEQAVVSTQTETRQYAKRQLTWFRKDPTIRWLDGFGGESRIESVAIETIRAFL